MRLWKKLSENEQKTAYAATEHKTIWELIYAIRGGEGPRYRDVFADMTYGGKEYTLLLEEKLVDTSSKSYTGRTLAMPQVVYPIVKACDFPYWKMKSTFNPSKWDKEFSHHHPTVSSEL